MCFNKVKSKGFVDQVKTWWKSYSFWVSPLDIIAEERPLAKDETLRNEEIYRDLERFILLKK
jgi:hypothetical protein